VLRFLIIREQSLVRRVSQFPDATNKYFRIVLSISGDRSLSEKLESQAISLICCSIILFLSEFEIGVIEKFELVGWKS
jgi:hypothetical protein